MKTNKPGTTALPLTQPRATQLQAALWDFLKMFIAMVFCGLAVSAIVAGIAIALAQDAHAASPVASFASDIEADVDTQPGMLLIGNGCDAEGLGAAERDWKVTIDGKNIEVRVMQTFIIPEGDDTAATFSALLPTGARLLRLAAHTGGAVRQGKVFDDVAHSKLTAADFRNLSRKGFLIVHDHDDAIFTDVIVNLAASEAVTVEYTYRIAAEEADGAYNLLVTLANDLPVAGAATGKPSVSGDVWVEWRGKKPARILAAPSGTSLESAGTQITGLSWATQQLNAGTRFQLAWTM